MTPAQKRAKDSFEERFKGKGAGCVTFRFSRECLEALDRIAAARGCSRRAVVEFLVLGHDVLHTLAKEHGLSVSEVEAMTRVR